jgi:hypothetical protein
MAGSVPLVAYVALMVRVVLRRLKGIGMEA